MQIMKKILATIFGLCLMSTLNLAAADAPAGTNAPPAKTAKAKVAKKDLTPEQKKLRQDLLDKYDADKNGKIDKTEAAKVTAEDRTKMVEVGLLKAAKKKAAAGN